jgi:acetone carboxylase gamma subunit
MLLTAADWSRANWACNSNIFITATAEEIKEKYQQLNKNKQKIMVKRYFLLQFS